MMIRDKISLQSHNADRKDRKFFEDRIKGPPVRLLCDVSDSHDHKLSHFICTILKEVFDEQPTIWDSTEDMVAAIKTAKLAE